VKNQTKEVVQLNENALFVFKTLKEYWSGRLSETKMTLNMNEIFELMEKPFKNSGRNHDLRSVYSFVQELVLNKILLRDPPEIKNRGKGGAGVVFELNWEFLEKHDVVKKLRGKSRSNTRAKKLICFKITDAPLDRRRKDMSYLLEHSTVNNSSDHFKRLITQNTKLDLEYFKGSAPDCLLPDMFFDGSFLETFFEKGVVALVARNDMEASLNGKEMKINHKYVIKFKTIYLLKIHNIAYIISAKRVS
jgi:hypothetical protein